MADIADRADRAGDLIDEVEAQHIARVRRAAAVIPRGEEGECEICETFYTRIVNGICCRCRDEFKL